MFFFNHFVFILPPGNIISFKIWRVLLQNTLGSAIIDLVAGSNLETLFGLSLAHLRLSLLLHFPSCGVCVCEEVEGAGVQIVRIEIS